MQWQSMNSVRKSASKGAYCCAYPLSKRLALIVVAGLVGACTSLPGPPGDPTKYKRTRVDGPGELSKVAYGKAEVPRNLPKSAWGNAPTYKVFGTRYSVMDSARGFREEGIASWYGSKFHGRQTSNGDVYNMYDMTAAHKHLPLPTFVRVTNLENNKRLVVKVNDRGPFVDDRIIDLSYGAAARLGMLETGTARVRIVAISENIEKPSLQHAKKEDLPAEPAQYVEILASGQHNAQSVLPQSEVVRQPRPVQRREAPKDILSAKQIPAAIQLPDASRLPTAVANSGTIIQVGAFGDPANAETMRLRVNQAVNDDAAVIIASASGNLLRVQIGPLPEEAPIEQIVRQLQRAGVEDIKLFEL